MKTATKITVLIIGLVLTACGEPSLEKYYVNNQEKDNFIVVNIPSSMLLGNSSNLSKTEKAALQRVEKANVLAYPLTVENKAVFEKEKAKLEKILQDDQYKLLMKFGSSDKQFRLLYLGDPDAIDEMIVYGSSEKAGFGVARILGDDMNPAAMIDFVKNLEKEDLSGLDKIETIFSGKDTPEGK